MRNNFLDKLQSALDATYERMQNTFDPLEKERLAKDMKRLNKKYTKAHRLVRG